MYFHHISTSRFIFYFVAILLFSSCDILSDIESDKNNEHDNTVYIITEDIGSFETVYVTTSGQIIATLLDENENYIVYMDNADINEKTALVAYINKTGNIEKLYFNGEVISIMYDDNDMADIIFTNEDGELEKIKSVKLTPKRTTKAGLVLDPYDLFTIATIGKDAGEILQKLIANKKITKEVAGNSITLLGNIGTIPYGNVMTAIGLGVIGVATAAPAMVTVAAILATIDIANAAISDWQDHTADKYYGDAIPITGEAIQLTSSHFCIPYEIHNLPDSAHFNVGVIVADGLFVTKNHHLIKETESFPKSSGNIIIDLRNLRNHHNWNDDNIHQFIKIGKTFKYRVFIEPQLPTGFEWDDELLDYWRYGEVHECIISKLPISVNSIEYTNTNQHNHFSMGARFEMSNDIPFVFEDWGVCLIESDADSIEVGKIEIDKGYDYSSISDEFLELHLCLSNEKMDMDSKPYVPIKNYFAVPYVRFNNQNYAITDNAFKTNFSYQEERPTPGKWVDLGYSVKWAGWNIGANKPEGFGGYYAWGETDTKFEYNISNYKHAERYVNADNDVVYRIKDIGTTICGTKYDVATVRWGDGARMPTFNEFHDLIWSSKIYTSYNGVYGLFIVGPSENSIFFPYAYINDNFEEGAIVGLYWTGETEYAYAAPYMFYMNSDEYNPLTYDTLGQTNGTPIRAVKDFDHK